MQDAFIVAVIPTFRRPAELERLLRGLDAAGPVLGAMVIVDNGCENAVRDLVSTLQKPAIYLPLESNPGPGEAWKRGAGEGMRHFSQQYTHILTLDDDVVIGPGVLEQLLAGMAEAKAGAAAPLLGDADGKIGALGVPEPVEPRLRRVIREVRTREDASRLLGNAPLEIGWCIGPCLLIDRETLAKAGPHRGDFWILGEDLEYSLRVSSVTRMVVIPTVVVPHLPPPPGDIAGAKTRDYLKFCALLQNVSYIALRLPGSRHLWRYLPGNFRRFFRTFGWSGLVIQDALFCFTQGSLAGRPAGHPASVKYRKGISSRARPA